MLGEAGVGSEHECLVPARLDDASIPLPYLDFSVDGAVMIPEARDTIDRL